MQRRHPILAPLSALALLPIFAAQPGAKTHQDYRRDAEAAYRRKEYGVAADAMLAALDLRPDSPRYLYTLAALSSLTGDTATAFDTLRQLAALGVVMPVQRDPDFARLQGTPEFLKILQLFSANREPRGTVEMIAELPGRTGIIEGLAFRNRTGELFLSDVHHRCIWRRDRNGQITRYTTEDEELFGIFGLALDEPRNTLWAATAAVPEMAGYEDELKGYSALAEFNLANSQLRRVIPVPGDGSDHGISDVLVAPDGTVYTTDSKAPIIWQLAPGAEEMQKFAESPLFGSLQGMVLVRGTLLVADYANGLFAIEVATGTLTELNPPKNTTLLGLDGIAAVSDGIVATQNGVEPQRLLRIQLSPELTKVTEVTVLASALPHVTDLTLVTIINNRPTFIAGSGWEGFVAGKDRQPAAHTVRLFQVELP